MARKKAADPAPEPVAEPPVIGPGDMLDVRVGVLESGEWYASLGAPDSDGLCVTSAFAFEALRGLAKILKGLTHDDLSAHGMAGEQEMGRCVHVSSDGSQCCAIDSPMPDVLAVLGALRLAAKAAPEFGDDEIGRLPGGFVEIVRLYAKLEKPKNTGDKDDEELSVTVKMTSDDVDPELKALKPHVGSEVLVIISKSGEILLPAMRDRLDQPALFDPTPDASVEVLACPGCGQIARGEGAMPGEKCPLCEFGTLEIRVVADLRCDKCGAPRQNTTFQIGDTCTLCGEGQYAITTRGRNGMSCQETCEKQETQEAQPTEAEQPAGEPETQSGDAPEGGEAEEKAEE